MKPSANNLAALALLANWFQAGHAAEPSWQPVIKGATLRVERRAYAGSGLNEIRGVTRIKASLNALMALLKDASFNHRWVYRSGGARILEEVGYSQVYVHGVVEVTYQVYGDPGGWVPLWIANYAAELSVTRTLQNMSAVVGRYEGKQSEFVEEVPSH